MSAKTAIEWTDATWNPVTGCDEVSPGCDRCYAKTFAERFRGVEGHYFEQGFDVVLRPDKLTLPLRWRKPRRVFVNSMSDLFHAKVSDEYIADVFAVMIAAPHHTFQVLTKRAGRMRSLLSSDAHAGRVAERLAKLWKVSHVAPLRGPVENIWLGVSVEDQKRADLRIPALIDTPAAKRFLSCEPLLGPLDLYGPVVNGHRPRLTYWLGGGPRWGNAQTDVSGLVFRDLEHTPGLDWVIVGGESGHGARPMHPDWVRTLRDQCAASLVPFFFKQWGEWAPESHLATERGAANALYIEHDGSTRPAATGARGNAITVQRNGKKHTGHLLDGHAYNQFPKEAPRA